MLTQPFYKLESNFKNRTLQSVKRQTLKQVSDFTNNSTILTLDELLLTETMNINHSIFVTQNTRKIGAKHFAQYMNLNTYTRQSIFNTPAIHGSMERGTQLATNFHTH